MKDNEVVSWLDPDLGEDVGFAHAIQDCRPGDADAYRKLAEVRKLLMRCEPHREFGTRCHVCGSSLREDHRVDCMFAYLMDLRRHVRE